MRTAKDCKMIFSTIIISMSFIAFPQKGTCQTENPRGIYKMTAFKTKWGNQGVLFEQYKACTDSVTLTFKLYNRGKENIFLLNRFDDVFYYTGEEPSSEDNKSTLIYNSNDKHFTLKWWVGDVAYTNIEFPELPKNNWVTEEYEAGNPSDAGKILFDAITQRQLADGSNPLVGVWKNVGVLLELNEEGLDSLKRGYPNTPYYEKTFYAFTPSFWAYTKPEGNSNGIVGAFNKVIYEGKDAFNDGVTAEPYQIRWINDNLISIIPKLSNGQSLNIVLERVSDGSSVFDRIANWFVPRDFNWFLRHAQAGNADAQCYLGSLYITGNGVEQDADKGMEWIRKGAEGGSKQAQLGLGMAYLRGEYVEKDEGKGFEWMHKAAEQGEPTAQLIIGRIYMDGENDGSLNVEKNEEEGLKWMEASAKGGLLKAQNDLGYYWFRKEEYQKAFTYFQSAAEKGDAEAQNQLGVMYSRGQGTEKDDAKAVELYQKSAEQGYAIAQCNLGFRYRDGNGVQKDSQKAFEFFLKAAEGGYASAQNEVAWMLYTGEDVPQDLPKAFEWAQKAVEQGNSFGYGTLGEMYYKGKGVAEDKVKAFELYLKGGELEDRESMRMLSIMYKNGEGTQKDKKKAVYWKKKYEAKAGKKK
ncbi:MAG: sel1 repeat family protein [Bacteroidaceae bacterium]|nr:sel1 repeat family protein [Bacteroidaceae bacterium]